VNFPERSYKYTARIARLCHLQSKGFSEGPKINSGRFVKRARIGSWRVLAFPKSCKIKTLGEKGRGLESVWRF
jgi:hypothetical protein